MTNAKTVLLLGASGLVGSTCLSRLSNDPVITRVVVLTRSPLSSTASNVEYHAIDFDNRESFRAYLNVESMICALGTTIAKAGSQAAFRKVDYEYVLQFARMAREAGANQFCLVSSIGADAESRVFYSRVKGEIEAAVSNLGYPSVVIVRPSLILGKRKEFRLAESISQGLLGPIKGIFPKKIRPVTANQIAHALIEECKNPAPGIRIIGNAEMV